MSESDAGHERDEPPAGPGADVPPAAFPEAKVPEVRVPAPTSRTDFPEPGEPVPHDVWGKVESSAARPAPPQEPEAEPFQQPEAFQQPEVYQQPEAFQPLEVAGTPGAPEPPAELPDTEDVKVAPVAEEFPHWEGSLFDQDQDEVEGDPRYVPAVPSGAAGPAKPGKPSSGNWQMPDWMADEAGADAKLGASPGPARGGRDGHDGHDGYDDLDGGGRTRLVLIGGVVLLVVALLAAAGVYLMKSRGDDTPAKEGKTGKTGKTGKAGRAASARRPEAPKAELPPDKRLKRYPGTPSKVLGRVADAHSGLAWPRLAAPWQLPTKKNKLGTAGWSGQQVLVTERHAGRFWYGQLLTGSLAPALRGAYRGPSSVKNVSGLAAKAYETQYYGFPHRTTPLASQALPVDGRQGWLIASYMTYKRPGVKATGEIVATAVIDTGRDEPAVVFASLPNTHRKLWPDLNAFLTGLKIAAP